MYFLSEYFRNQRFWDVSDRMFQTFLLLLYESVTTLKYILLNTAITRFPRKFHSAVFIPSVDYFIGIQV